VSRAAEVGGLPPRPSGTAELRLHGAEDAGKAAPTLNAERVRRAAREEMARTVEDVLARRWRRLFLDAGSAVAAAPMVAAALAAELSRDELWCEREVRAFREGAAHYLPGAAPMA
jgi:glycerol-3-phosphate dehydrogenase